MTKVLIMFLALLVFSIGNETYSQCTINASPDTVFINSGDPVILSSSGSCQYTITEDFNSGQLNSFWVSSASPMFNNPCGYSLDSTIYLWIGPVSNFPRELDAGIFDLSSGNCVISFEMRYAIDGDASPCEGPESVIEGVHFQYSTTGSTGPWTDINYWDPNGGHDTSRTNWNIYTEVVPPAAATPATWFRWYQTNSSGADFDHWGLDNMNITCPSTSTVSWSHGPTVFNPPTVYPISDTMFIVTIQDTVAGSIPFSDTVFVKLLTSIEENHIADFNIYPNPTNGIFTVEGENIELVTITDISGKVILEREVNTDILEIDLSEYSKAIYFVKVYTEDGMGVKKILIE